jgi:hypothetical protein
VRKREKTNDTVISSIAGRRQGSGECRPESRQSDLNLRDECCGFKLSSSRTVA